MKIKKNDTVVVLSGKDKGKQGKVLSTMPTVGKVLVEGVNMADCHVKPTRCGYKILEDGSKTRFCSGKRGCGETF